ncbi:ankyrin repeat domain-containing protein [Aspergillus stella-maris]|uniref:ankyrin repeat domain-containing protein n=1 Tax=Aspergillus stella-maris TaxID=1810926 RepID=UPI003CCDDE02
MALPLLYAAATGDNALIEQTHAATPALLKSINPSGQTALHLAAHHNETSTLRLLLSYNLISRSARDDKGQTPLHIAAQGASPDMVEILLQNDDGTSCSARDKDGKTAIFYAYQNPCLEVLAVFLRSAPSCGSGCALTPEIILRSGASDYFGSAVAKESRCCGRGTATTRS